MMQRNEPVACRFPRGPTGDLFEVFVLRFAVRSVLPKEALLRPDARVETDQIHMPFGKLRLKGQGSAGGHNGLKDIQATLGSDVYVRLRFGVDANFPKGRQVDYVLNPFSADELIELPTRIEKAGEAILAFGAMGLERAMNVVNVK